MASNGSAVSDWKQTAEIKEGTEEPFSSMPDTARKPLPSSNRPRPPIPKKPPVGPKPPSPLPASHSNPLSLIPSHPHSASSSPTTHSQLSPFAHHLAATTPVDNGTGPKPVKKGPPPPLPKNPPKGAPAESSTRSRVPPPRPSQLAPSKPSPAPVPAKRPASRTPEKTGMPADQAPQKNDEGSAKELTSSGQTSSREQSSAYEQVIVEENGTVAEREESISSQPPPLASCVPPKENPYQQVIVQQDVDRFVTLNTDSVVCLTDSVTEKPTEKSYENVPGTDSLTANCTMSDIDSDTSEHDVSCVESSGSLSGSAGQHSYEKIVVEENSQLKNSNGISKPLRPVRTVFHAEEAAACKQRELAVTVDDQQGAFLKHAFELTVQQDAEAAVCPLAAKSEDGSCIPKEEAAFQHTLKPQALNCPPKSPPPVRPKPKKRLSRLRDEGALEQNCSDKYLQTSGENSSENNGSCSGGSDSHAVGLLSLAEPVCDDSAHQLPCVSFITAAAGPEAEPVSELDVLNHQSNFSQLHMQEVIYQEIDELEMPPASSEPIGDRTLTFSNKVVPRHSDQTDANQEAASPASNKDNPSTCQSLTERENILPTNDGLNCKPDISFIKTVQPKPRISSRTHSLLSPVVQQASATEETKADSKTDWPVEASNREQSQEPKKSSEREPVCIGDVEETSCMLKEIEQLLSARGVGLDKDQTAEGEADTSSTHISTSASSLSLQDDTPVRPPRPRRADKLRKLTISGCSLDSSSTESLNTVGVSSSGKKAPPKPKRQHVQHKDSASVTRSSSDVTGMKRYVSQLSQENEAERKPFLPQRLESLRYRATTDPQPPPLPPRNKSMERTPQDPLPSPPVSRSSSQGLSEAGKSEGRVSVGRTPTGSKQGKHIPRPTRKAPPPPSIPPNRLHTQSVTKQASADCDKAQVCAPDKAVVISSSITEMPVSPRTQRSSASTVPGYQKIVSGSSPCESLLSDTAAPKAELPVHAETCDDSDYHEICDQKLVETLVTERQGTPHSKEETPPPDLPPRSYQTPPPTASPQLVTSSPHDPVTATRALIESARRDSLKTSEKEVRSESSDSGFVIESEAGSSLQTSSIVSSHTDTSIASVSSLSPDDADSLMQSDQPLGTEGEEQAPLLPSCPESFSSEVLGSLQHVVGESISRPESSHSSSNHSDIGSAGAEAVPSFDESSASESDSEDDEEKMKRKRDRKVFYIAEEVMKSEQVFVDVLKLLNVDFRQFMSEKTEQAGHTIVPTETLNKILDFLPQLQSFNEVLLKDLKERIANWDEQKKIADIFKKKGPFLKLYSSYIRNFEHATALLDEACKKHHNFGMALQQFEMSPRCASLALKHYMLKPIQRIPQYKLLLQDYLKHLPPNSPDYADTIIALNIVSEVADHANESMRHGDNVQKLLEIQRSLIGQFEVIMPGRVLVRKGVLMKLSRKEMQPRMFFLFNDVLLYTTPTAGGFRLNNILTLQGMKVNPPKFEELKNEFHIISTQRSLTVAAQSPEEREVWLNALWNAIDENSERYHTFKALQPEPKTSLLDKDFVLGQKAPLWVPDKRVTMCMICLAEFSITWRRHHCRACGRIICGNCSKNKAQLRYLVYKLGRVCDECFQKLPKDQENTEKSQPASNATSPGPVSDESATSPTPVSADGAGAAASSLGESTGFWARFQWIRRSARDDKPKVKTDRPAVLREVTANDEGSDMSGYLWVAKNKKWKRLWFVVKGKVLYTYKASEDMAAIESMPLLGFEVTRMTSWYQGAEPDLMFELRHQNTQPLVFKSRNSSSSSGGYERVSGSVEENCDSNSSMSSQVKSSTDTTTPRLVFRTDSSTATNKWLNVLREASLA